MNNKQILLLHQSILLVFYLLVFFGFAIIVSYKHSLSDVIIFGTASILLIYSGDYRIVKFLKEIEK